MKRRKRAVLNKKRSIYSIIILRDNSVMNRKLYYKYYI